MIRAFTAIQLPNHALEAVAETGRKLKALQLDGRPTRQESIHLTLRFLGDIESSQVEPIRRALESVASRNAPFQTSLRRMGVFPDLAKPRIVWLGVEPFETLSVLQKDVESAFTGLGFTPESRPFKPHLTVMRLKSPRNLDSLLRFLREEGFRKEGPVFEVADFHLYQSELKPEGAQYAKIASFPLSASAS